ncbi:MAG: mobilization protein, partial [Firmicutes bacterium]|nr:mobilization protein [Bacillota bacterium]
YAALREKAEALHITPAQWLRDAALKRRLPSAPVPAINVAEYGKLARLSANLNQLVKLVHEGRPVTINEDMIRRLLDEVTRLRLALLGHGEEDA